MERTAGGPGQSSAAQRRARAATRVVCAWCQASLPAQSGSTRAGAAVSHGLCAPCARRLARRAGKETD